MRSKCHGSLLAYHRVARGQLGTRLGAQVGAHHAVTVIQLLHVRKHSPMIILTLPVASGVQGKGGARARQGRAVPGAWRKPRAVRGILCVLDIQRPASPLRERQRRARKHDTRLYYEIVNLCSRRVVCAHLWHAQLHGDQQSIPGAHKKMRRGYLARSAGSD